MIRNYLHIFTNLPGILARINSELEGKASKASVDTLRHTVGKKADQDHVSKLAEIAVERFRDRPTHADLSQAKIDLGVRLDRLKAIIEKTGLADLATTLDQIAADQPEPEPGLRESIRETIAKAKSNLEAVKTGEPSLPVFIGDAPAVAGSIRYVDPRNNTFGGPDLGLTSKVSKARKPRAPKGGAK